MTAAFKGSRTAGVHDWMVDKLLIRLDISSYPPLSLLHIMTMQQAHASHINKQTSRQASSLLYTSQVCMHHVLPQDG